MTETRAIAVTGLGLLTALGPDRATSWRRLLAGETGVRRITRFPTAHLRIEVAATVEDERGEAPHYTWRNLDGARRVLREALAQSGLDAEAIAGARLFVATAQGGMYWHQRFRHFEGVTSVTPDSSILATTAAAATAHPERDLFEAMNSEHVGVALAEDLGVEAPVIVVNTACATGATAIQLAVDALRDGECTLALVVGADFSVSAENVARFSLLSALSRRTEPEQTPRPFSESRDGFVLGEGAGALVLERVDAAARRGARPLAYVLGHGDHTENYHRTRSDPSAKGAIACMEAALADAGIPPERIDCVNAHGTGTTENDQNEEKSIQAVFGEHAARVWVTSNKSMIGHTLTAAGVIEAALSVLSVAEDLVPPTRSCEDPGVSLRVANQGAERGVATVISNSFGFGGQNVSVVIAREL